MIVGLVCIGRNEGDRLRRCLESVVREGVPCVYVDSNSTDGSVELARSMGVEAVELDLSIPFTAARARNAGIARLLELHPATEAIQVIDGDCILQHKWIEVGAKQLEADPGLAVVFGLRGEIDPKASIYNHLCDMEWDLPPGEMTWFGGDALIRRTAFDQAGGYDPSVIAGEEPDLAVRMRKHGWTIRCIDHPMSRHDAAITHFSQWWKRSTRAGHALAEGAHRHGPWTQPYNLPGVVNRLAWATVPIVLAIALFFVIGWWAVFVLGLYDLLWLKTAWGAFRAGRKPYDAGVLATFIVLAKWPESLGILKFHINRLTGKKTKIIEYKSPSP